MERNASANLSLCGYGGLKGNPTVEANRCQVLCNIKLVHVPLADPMSNQSLPRKPIGEVVLRGKVLWMGPPG